MRGLWRALAEVAWPPRCPVCDGWYEPPSDAWIEVDGRACVHRACVRTLRPRPALVVRPSRGRVPVVALVHDHPGWFAVLHRVKYGGEARQLAPWIELCAGAIEAGGGIPPESIVVPVPDDHVRRRERGFSPVTMIAAGLARDLGARLRTDLIRRRGAKPSQAGLDDDVARARNVEGVFGVGRLAEVPATSALIVVDDQVTSGSTLRAAVTAVGARGNPIAVVALARASRAPQAIVTTGSAGVLVQS